MPTFYLPMCLFQDMSRISWYIVYRSLIFLHASVQHVDIAKTMITSLNGNSFRVTGPSCGEFTDPWWIPTQRPVTRRFGVFFDLLLDKRLKNNGNAGDLRRNGAHYGVTVMTPVS